MADDDLRQDIEDTREHLAETVDALSAKLDVKSRASDAVGAATHSVKDNAAHATEAVSSRVDPTWALVSVAAFTVSAVAYLLSRRN